MTPSEVFRRACRLFNERDDDAWVALWDEDCVWQPATMGGVEGEGATYRGHAGVRQYLQNVFSDFDELRMEPDEVEELGSVALATGRAIGRGRQSGADVTQPIAWVVEIGAAGLAVRAFSSFDMEAARRTALEWCRDVPEVERVRRAYAALSEQDPAPFRELCAEDVELYVPPGFLDGTGVHRGKEAVLRWFGDALGVWEPLSFDLRVEAVGGRVLAHGRWSARGERSGLPAGGEIITVFTFRDGKVGHVAHFPETGL